MTRSHLARRHVLRGVAAAGLIPLFGGAVAAAPSADDARAVVQEVGDAVLAILQDGSLDDRQKLDRLVAVLDGPIDLPLAARLILGRKWRMANEAQQADYLQLFHDYALANLASKLHLYQGQTFEVVDAKPVGKRDALVTSRILSDGGPPLKVDWRLREDKDARLTAIDMIVEGVSLIVTLRSEFAAVIERYGFDGLLAELRQRIAQQAQSA